MESIAELHVRQGNFITGSMVKRVLVDTSMPDRGNVVFDTRLLHHVLNRLLVYNR